MDDLASLCCFVLDAMSLVNLLSTLYVVTLVSRHQQGRFQQAHSFEAAYAIDDVRYMADVLLYHPNICLRKHRRRSHTINSSCRRKFHKAVQIIGYCHLARRCQKTHLNSARVHVGFT